MDIKDSKNINNAPIDTHGGNVHLGDNYYKSIEYKELQKTIARLEKLIQLTKNGKERSTYHQELAAEKSKLEVFKQGVISLAETFQKIEIDTERLKSAKRFFDEGKFKEARAILDTEKIDKDQKKLLERRFELAKKSDQNEEDLKNNSDEYLVLAKLTAIDFNQADRFEKTIAYFESSLKSNRNEDNLFSYALFLKEHNQNNKATPLYLEALEVYRKLAEDNPQTYLPDLGMILNDLANLHRVKNEFEQAEKSCKQALEIRRQLAEDNPQAFLPDLGRTLNNLAVLQKNQNEFKKAEKSYLEALEIYRKLEEDNPQSYLPNHGKTLNNLANLQKNKNEFEKAEKSYREALEMYRKLAKKNPQTYLPYLAVILNNLANLLSTKNEFRKAEKSYREALKIDRKLAKENPQSYLPNVATTLNNLANLQTTKNEFDRAENSYIEALEIYQKLAKENPQSYLPNVATTLNNLAVLQKAKNEFDNAEKSYKQALKIYRKLVEENPQTYIPDLSMTQINMSIFYQKSKVNKELSMELVDEAITNLLPFSKIPYIQNYLEVALKVLKDWEIDAEAYLVKKKAASNS